MNASSEQSGIIRELETVEIDPAISVHQNSIGV
jgi:hypothetical protein